MKRVLTWRFVIKFLVKSGVALYLSPCAGIGQVEARFPSDDEVLRWEVSGWFE